MAKARLAEFGDTLDARDVASVLGISYIKTLKLLKTKVIPRKQIGRTYHVSKQVFEEWLNSPESVTIALD